MDTRSSNRVSIYVKLGTVGWCYADLVAGTYSIDNTSSHMRSLQAHHIAFGSLDQLMSYQAPLNTPTFVDRCRMDPLMY